MKSPQIEVKSDVLRWARESSGYSIDEVAKKINILSNTVVQWEAKPSKISYSTVAKLAKILKRPAIALLLNKPPSEPSLPSYFRRNNELKELSPDIRIAIRKARHLQHTAKNLEENLKFDAKKIVESASLSDAPDKIAERERNNLGITTETQLTWRDPRIALNEFRKAIENKNIFIFQMALPTEQAQGFSLPDYKAPVIVLNSKDMYERRLFTLFHEYAHILLGESGVCTDLESQSDNQIERWCDQFAGSFLVPKEDLLSKISDNTQITYEKLSALAKSFSVSKHMVFVRMSITGKLSAYDKSVLSKIFSRNKDNVNKKSASKGGIPPHRRCLSQKGNKFVSLVLENSRKNQITTSEALGHLEVKLNNLPKLEATLNR
ncbi:MAG: XRE family transcriptional regulator [Candidatus Micrarchaeia archaeon]|jgi:Zn-dependent peptidase ImmA (M78 family)/DNA-binding XRE family transcriptional regulator